MTRRQILVWGLTLPVAGLAQRTVRAAQDLSKFTAGAPACNDARKLTPAASDGKTFKPGAPMRTMLVEPGTAGGRKLALSGYVIGLKCGQIKGATVDVWQADAKGMYDTAGFKLRGRQLTDADGKYHVETIVPGASAGRARHLNVRVQPPGKPALTTELFFPDETLNARDPEFKPDLAMKVTENRDGLTATFDLILDL